MYFLVPDLLVSDQGHKTSFPVLFSELTVCILIAVNPRNQMQVQTKIAIYNYVYIYENGVKEFASCPGVFVSPEKVDDIKIKR